MNNINNNNNNNNKTKKKRDPPRLLRSRGRFQRVFGHGRRGERRPRTVPRRHPKQRSDDRSRRPPGKRERRFVPRKRSRVYVFVALFRKLLFSQTGIGSRHRTPDRVRRSGKQLCVRLRTYIRVSIYVIEMMN